MASSHMPPRLRQKRALVECPLVDREVRLVAAARRGLEPGTVADPDVAARIADEVAALERARRLRNAHAPHAEHHREELVGDVEGRGMRAIRRHEHPPGEALLDDVEAVAPRRLRELADA